LTRPFCGFRWQQCKRFGVNQCIGKGQTALPGKGGECCQRIRTQPTRRHIGNPVETQGIGGVIDDTQVCQHITHHSTIIESGRAAQRIRNTRMAQRRLKSAAHVARTVEHCNLVRTTTPLQELGNAARHSFGFIACILCIDNLERRRIPDATGRLRLRCTQRHRLNGSTVTNDRISSIKYWLTAAIVGSQFDHPCIGEISFEARNDCVIGIAEAIDRLHAITNGKQ